MDYLTLTAGILATFATIGHFTMGAKDFLTPVMNSTIDEIPKKVMQSLFHYMSVFMILTSIILIAISMDEKLIFENTKDVVKIIGIIYAGFGLIQFMIAITSSIKLGVFKLFQWVFWALIAILTQVSVY